MGRVRVAAVLVVMVAISIGAIALLTPPPSDPASGSPPPSPGPAGTPSVAPSADGGPFAPLEGVVMVVDGRFDARAEREIRSPSRHKNQSKLFFAEGSWWGVLKEPTTRETRIHRLDWATQRWHDTGVVVDDRAYALSDVLFADGHLYVASSGSSPESDAQAVLVSRYTIDPESDTWRIDPDFPVAISRGGVTSVVIERQADGRLWVTYIQDGTLNVAHSIDRDERWVEPFQPPIEGTRVAVDQVGIAALDDEIVLLWSNQNDEAVYAATHVGADGSTGWSQPTTVVSSLAVADDHVNVKAAPDGRLFAVAKTSLDTVPAAQPGWDQVLLLDRTVDGTWSSHQVGQLRDRHTRPIVVIDAEHDRLLVFATTPTSGGAIHMKTASLDDVSFPVGLGTPVIAFEDSPRINDATSTKQAVDATTGIVVLATDDTTGRYVHMAASLGGPLPGQPQGPPPDGPEPPPGIPVVLVDAPFDAFRAGEPVPLFWRSAPTRSDGTFELVERGDGLAARATLTGRGEFRPCRETAHVTSGTVLVRADLRLDRGGTTDTNLLMVRGEGEEVMSIRVDPQGRARVSEADRRETTNLVLQRGAWYRATVRLDTADRTFDLTIETTGGATLLERTGRPWRSAEATGIDGVCISPATGSRGAAVSIDDLLIVRGP